MRRLFVYLFVFFVSVSTAFAGDSAPKHVQMDDSVFKATLNGSEKAVVKKGSEVELYLSVTPGSSDGMKADMCFWAQTPDGFYSAVIDDSGKIEWEKGYELTEGVALSHLSEPFKAVMSLPLGKSVIYYGGFLANGTAHFSNVLVEVVDHEINASCGSANGKELESEPAGEALCTVGKPTKVKEKGSDWLWKCRTDEGSTSSCSGKKLKVVVDGKCGGANNQSLTNKPTSDFCSAGKAGKLVFKNGKWTWECLGLGGGKKETCSATKQSPKPTDGVCGPAKGGKSQAEPASDQLCSTEKFGSVTLIGNKWLWSCPGINGGKDASCTASRDSSSSTPVNGVCGTANGQSLDTAPTGTVLCSGGSAGTVTTGTSGFTWSCAGSSGGTTANCSAAKQSTASYTYAGTVAATGVTQKGTNLWEATGVATSFASGTTVYVFTTIHQISSKSVTFKHEWWKNGQKIDESVSGEFKPDTIWPNLYHWSFLSSLTSGAHSVKVFIKDTATGDFVFKEEVSFTIN